jgi:hypothetical protein
VRLKKLNCWLFLRDTHNKKPRKETFVTHTTR